MKNDLEPGASCSSNLYPKGIINESMKGFWRILIYAEAQKSVFIYTVSPQSNNLQAKQTYMAAVPRP